MLLVRRVADQVHEDTMPEAMRPGLTEREAVLNSSDVWVEKRVCVDACQWFSLCAEECGKRIIL